MTTAAMTLTGLYLPLITPFTAAGSIDAPALEALAHRVLADGADGIVALGTTAEAPTLTDAERRRVLDICASVCRDRSATLIAGAGGNDTRRTAEALAGLTSWPEVQAALVVVPYYSRPGEQGVLAHFRALAAASPVPLVIYNIPYRTGRPVSWPTLRQIAEMPGVAGVKHAAGGIDADTVAMLADRPDGFSVLGGDDVFTPAMLALGASGAIYASAHVATPAFALLVRAWQAGDVAVARPLGHRLTRLAAALFAEPNPTVIKAVLHRLGEISSPAVRLPLLAAHPESADIALELAATLDADLAATAGLQPARA
jgi:4-hydroxy-tetrahydrodipicolinate synthase